MPRIIKNYLEFKLIPTTEASKLCITQNKELDFTEKFLGKSGIGFTPHYLYVTSSRTPKKGDKVLHKNDILTVTENKGTYLSVEKFYHIDIRTDACKLIEFTNDPGLISIHTGVIEIPGKASIENIKPSGLVLYEGVEVAFFEEFIERYKNTVGINARKLAEDYYGYNYEDSKSLVDNKRDAFVEGHNQASQSREGLFVLTEEKIKEAMSLASCWHIAKLSDKEKQHSVKEFIDSLTPKSQCNIKMWCEMEECGQHINTTTNRDGNSHPQQLRVKLDNNRQPIIHFEY
jgi:hypothetical protein